MAGLTSDARNLRASIAKRSTGDYSSTITSLAPGPKQSGSWLLTIITLSYVARQLEALPLATTLILVAWVLAIVLVVWGELRIKHTPLSRWLKNNLISSVSNTLLTLLLALLIVVSFLGIWQWAVVNATFDSTRTAPEFQPEDGATWGVVWGARKLLLTGLLAPDLSWRVWLSLGFIVALWAATFVSGRSSLKKSLRPVRLATNVLWLLSPIILYIFLAGVPNTDYNCRHADRYGDSAGDLRPVLLAKRGQIQYHHPGAYCIGLAGTLHHLVGNWPQRYLLSH